MGNINKQKTLSKSIETVRVSPPAEQQPLATQVEKTQTRKKSYVMDLRVHSPAALGYIGIDGIDAAPALVRLAKVKGLDLIGITDFYGSEFIDRVRQAAQNSPVTVIAGVDLRCTLGACNDVVLSCFFPDHFGSGEIKQFLGALKIPESARGNRNYQVAVDFETVLATVDQFGGFALPSRIDKTPQRMNIIPLLVEQYGFRAFEVAYPEDTPRYFKGRWPKTKFHLFSFSNATALAQVGTRIARVKMPLPGFEGIKGITVRENRL